MFTAGEKALYEHFDWASEDTDTVKVTVVKILGDKKYFIENSAGTVKRTVLEHELKKIDSPCKGPFGPII